QDVVRHRRRIGPVEPVLEEHDAGDLRVVARREEDEPAVVAEVGVLVQLLRAQAVLIGDDLRRPRLAADVVSFDAGAAAGAAAVDDAPHAVPDRLELFRPPAPRPLPPPLPPPPPSPALPPPPHH